MESYDKLDISEMYESYEHDFECAMEDTTVSLRQLKGLSHLSEHSTIMRNILSVERNLKSAESSLKQMQVEVDTMPPRSKYKYKSKIEQYRSDFKNARSQVYDLKQKHMKNSSDDTEKVDGYLKSLSKNNRNLTQAVNTAYHTEIMARDIKVNLHGNSEKLQGKLHNFALLYKINR